MRVVDKKQLNSLAVEGTLSNLGECLLRLVCTIFLIEVQTKELIWSYKVTCFWELC